MLAEQMAYLRSHFTFLPYDDRVEAKALLDKWRKLKRLDQMQQLRVDKLIEKIEWVRARRTK